MRRLLLFDIDGTLVWGGPAKRSFRRAMVDTFGTAGDIEVHDFAGKTDPQIARELLSAAGVPEVEIDAGLLRLWDRYVFNLEHDLVDDPMDVLPGVEVLLQALAGEGGVAMGLLTGNIARGARLKLGSVGLAGPFDGVGGFGSDSEERNELPRIAIERAREAFGVDFRREEVVVVGDTPRDIECGLVEGLRTFGVATGRFAFVDLVAAGAHDTVEDLTSTGDVIRTLLRQGARSV